MFEKVKQYILDNLIKSNGHITIQRMNEEYIRRTATPEVADALLSTEGTCLRDQILYYTKGKLHCARCGKHILPYPKFLGADKFYCSKECAHPAQKPKTCCVCQKEFYSSNPKQVTCSRECGVVYRESRHMEKYGCKSPQQRPEIVKKTKQTLIDKYGADCTMNIPGVKEKSKQTMLKKYGVDHNMKSSEFMQQYKEVFAENARKGREVYQERTGLESPMHHPDFHKKASATFQEKYGVSMPFESEEIRNKALQTKYDRMSDIRKQMRDKNWWIENYIPGKTSIESLSYETGIPYGTLYDWAAKSGVTLENPKRSDRENAICQFLDSQNISYVISDKTIINPYELDIVIPDFKIAIEINGCYWHRFDLVGDRYHINKTLKCREVGYSLIHVWDNESLIDIYNLILLLVGKIKDLSILNKYIVRSSNTLEFDLSKDIRALLLKHNNFKILEKYTEPMVRSIYRYDVYDCGTEILEIVID